MKKTQKAKYSKYAIASAISALLFIVLPTSGLLDLFPYGSYAEGSYNESVAEAIWGTWLPLLAVILGIIAILDIRKNKRKGRWMAILGLLVGLGWFLLLDMLKRIGTV